MDRRDFAARRMRVCFSGPPDSRRELDRHTATPATMPRQHVDDTFDSLARATSIGSKLRRCNRQRMAVAGPRRGRSGGQSLARRWRWQGTSQHGARRGRVKALRSVRCRSCSSSRCAVGADGHDRRRQAHIRVTPQAVCTSMAPAEQALDRDGGLERHGRAPARDGGLKRSRGEMLPPRTLGTHTLPPTAKCKSHRQASSSSLPVPRHCRSCSGSTSIARGCLSLGFLELRVVQLAAADAVRARARNPALCRPSAVPGPGYRESASG